MDIHDLDDDGLQEFMDKFDLDKKYVGLPSSRCMMH